MFQQYVEHGWALCAIPPGEKGPRTTGWNEKANAVKLEDAGRLRAAGLCHAYSGTCAFDIDDLEKTAAAFPEVADMFLDPSMVRIDSGQPNRGKFIFALSEPLQSKVFLGGAFELRCATGTGKTAQDVLPPSPHPKGTTYKWVGDWKQLPTLPEFLKKLWLSEINPISSDKTVSAATNLSELEALVLKRDPSCGYDEWIKIGMAIHHETEGSEEGFALWDNWSNDSKKYAGIADLRGHWKTFGRSSKPVTINSLRRTDTADAGEFDVVVPEDDGTDVPFDFREFTLPELSRRPEPDWLIPGILPEKGLGSFWGQPGSGKTFLAVDIALAVAAGSHWRGQPLNKSGKVLYIAAEDDAGVQARFTSALASRCVPDANVTVIPAAPSFTSTKQQEALLKRIVAGGKRALVVVDTLAAVTPGTDENTTKDVGPIIAFCNKIAKVAGGLVILIHHSRKDGDSLRGSSAMHAAFDFEWKVTEETTHREMYLSKMKNAEANKGYAFHLMPAGKSCIVEWI